MRKREPWLVNGPIDIAMGMVMAWFVRETAKVVKTSGKDRFPRWGENRRIATRDGGDIANTFDPVAFEGPESNSWWFKPSEVYQNKDPREMPVRETRWHVYRAKDEFGRRLLVFPVPFLGVRAVVWQKPKLHDPDDPGEGFWEIIREEGDIRIEAVPDIKFEDFQKEKGGDWDWVPQGVSPEEDD